MGSTTLMTFLVRTPPMTRTVSLLGSWDNFTTPYIMRRDSRIGHEHWSGCHSFANIICDGHGQAAGGPRQGGLKMGGTYWYYYKLDDDIEFHNSAEPSTTQCPLLPGQLVNVLHVPFTLAVNRARNASVSSTGSEVQTLNPADKFLNPRPVPQPILPRLKTSPSVLQTSWSSYNSPQSSSSATPISISTTRGQSQPNSATGVRMLKIRRSPSLNHASRSVSPNQQRGRGFRKAFRTLTSPRSDSPEATMDRKLRTPNQNISNIEQLHQNIRPQLHQRFEMGNRSASTSRERTPTSAGGASAPATDLALRKAVGQMYGSNDKIAYNSFQGHRRQRTRSREPSPLRNLPMLDIAKVPDVNDPRYQRQMLLSTVKEIASVQNTPQEAPTTSCLALKELLESKQAQPDLEKRLPTLPNTPSSAYPVSADSTPSKGESDEFDLLQSHFSCTTIETGSIRNSLDDDDDDDDLNRDSDWISEVHNSLQPSAYTPSFIEDEPMSPEQREEFLNLRLLIKDNPTDEDESDGVTTPQAEYFSRHNGVLSTISCTTFSSSAPASTTTSPVEHHIPGTFWIAPVRSDSLKAPTTWNKFQHYRLPSDGSNPNGVPKNYDTQINVPDMATVESDHTVPEQVTKDTVDPSIPHSTNMRQLLDELSYLGNMIQQN